MDSVQDILERKDFTEPPEVAVIKQYVQTEFQIAVSVLMRERNIVVIVPSAALANTLRLRSPALRRLCRTDKRLIFRIG